MSDPNQLALVYTAIRSGLTGCCEWVDKEAERVRADPDLQGLTPEYIRQRLQQFVSDEGGQVEQVAETRPHFSHREYYYKAIIPEPGFRHGLFVELELTDDDPEVPSVTLLNAHSQRR
ncbi:MAG TPA: hypothetical protein VFA18_03430 [Gemmataceae bacterium]|nr:hypothetical protein [Gemmataceae bacterium]